MTEHDSTSSLRTPPLNRDLVEFIAHREAWKALGFFGIVASVLTVLAFAGLDYYLSAKIESYVEGRLEAYGVKRIYETVHALEDEIEKRADTIRSYEEDVNAILTELKVDADFHLTALSSLVSTWSQKRARPDIQKDPGVVFLDEDDMYDAILLLRITLRSLSKATLDPLRMRLTHAIAITLQEDNFVQYVSDEKVGMLDIFGVINRMYDYTILDISKPYLSFIDMAPSTREGIRLLVKESLEKMQEIHQLSASHFAVPRAQARGVLQESAL